MPQFVRRPSRIVILAVALAAALTMTVEAGAASPPSTTDAHIAAATKATPKRRARRSPPGGVYSRYAAVMDPTTGELLFEKDANSPAPIASITKLMTAQVFVEQNPDLSRTVEVTRAELSGGGHTQLRNHEKVALGDLLHMSLMCSDNVATRVLVRESGLSEKAFLRRMNLKAADLGMTRSHFVEFTGLDAGNVATAADVARMLQAAANNDVIHEISVKRQHDFKTRLRWHTIPNTNRLLYSDYEIKGGKTGFIRLAGYCFATWLRTEGRDMIAVVLNAPTPATRFADVRRLVRRTLKADASS